MAAPTTAAGVKKTLANLEPSTHGPSGLELGRQTRERVRLALQRQVMLSFAWATVLFVSMTGRSDCGLIRVKRCDQHSVRTDNFPKETHATPLTRSSTCHSQRGRCRPSMS